MRGTSSLIGEVNTLRAEKKELQKENAALRAALERIQDICKPLSVGMDGPHWMANPLVGGGSKEAIWRICAAALATAQEADHD